MMQALWQSNGELLSAARWRSTRGAGGLDSRVAELAILATLGALAAIATTVHPTVLRLPGNAILRGTLPLILGISLVPRRTAGGVMSLAAAATFGVLRWGGLGLPNAAALVGLLCLGPAIDVALHGAHAGWRLYARFAIAGFVANMISFGVRVATFATPARTWAPGSGMGGGRGMGPGGDRGMGMGDAAVQAGVEQFWPVAMLSFAVFGAVAGLVCAMIWFRARPRQPGDAAS
jgi:hypothetical protein